MMNQFIFPLKIYVEDTDYGGVVYHSNYLKFFERARTEWIESLGMDFEWQQKEKVFFAVRSAKLDFLKPARLGQVLEVVTAVQESKRFSMTFVQHLRLSSAPDTILCSAEIKIACLDEGFRPRQIPHCKLHDIITGEVT